MGYAVKITTDYESGFRSEGYLKSITPICINLTGNLNDAATFATKAEARKLLSEYHRKHRRRKSETCEIIQVTV